MCSTDTNIAIGQYVSFIDSSDEFLTNYVYNTRRAANNNYFHYLLICGFFFVQPIDCSFKCNKIVKNVWNNGLTN